MSHQDTVMSPPPAPQAPLPQPPQAAAPKKQLNVVGLIALIAGVLGAVFAVVPGAAVVGWLLLPVAFILGIVSLFMKGKGKGMGIAGLVLSVVGTIAGVIAFVAVVGNAVSDAVNDASGGDTSIVQPGDQPADDVEQGAADGTRENPFAIGSTVANDDWQVTVNSVTLDATDAVMAENQFNQAPDAGSEYILVNLTMTYIGEDSGMPALVRVGFVTADGVTVNGYDSLAVAPDELNTTTTLYNGGAVTGNLSFAVPSAAVQDGVISIQLSLVGSPVFVSVV